MHFTLVCPSDPDDVFDVPENRGFAYELIVERLSSRGEDSFEVIDGSRLSEAEREAVYGREAVAAAGNRYRIRRVFGSNKAGMGPFLGRQVPALLCYDGERAVDVFPHEDSAGRVTTIANFLGLES